MLLIQGELIHNASTDTVIDRLHQDLVYTLTKPPLSAEIVMEASEMLLQDYLYGSLKTELKPYLDGNDLLPFEIEANIKQFSKESLQKRLASEIGHLHLNEAIHVAPKGVVLHIAAGNLDVLPAYSALEGLLTGNINLLKLPSSDNGLSIFLLKKLLDYQPLLRAYVYVFDTHSSDLLTIQKLMEFSNAIVIWGSDESISSVRKNAPVNSEIIEWGHKLSFAYLYDPEVTDESLTTIAHHLFVSNQLLCDSCQGIFVNTEDMDVIEHLAKRLSGILAELEGMYPLPDYLQGKLSINLRTRRLESLDKDYECYINQRSSVSFKEDSMLELSDLYANPWIKPLPIHKIHNALFLHKSHLQTVMLSSMHEPAVRAFAQVGCTQIRLIQNLSRMSLNRTHDGKFSLNEYIRLVELS